MLLRILTDTLFTSWDAPCSSSSLKRENLAYLKSFMLSVCREL